MNYVTDTHSLVWYFTSDRLIVATAKHYESILITKDINIINSKLITAIW